MYEEVKWRRGRGLAPGRGAGAGPPFSARDIHHLGLYLTNTRYVPRAPSRAAANVLEAPVRVHVPVLDVERLTYVEIRDRRSREVATVIEVPSPTSKRPGPDQDQ